MVFDNIEMVIEQRGLSNNLHNIINNLPKSEKTPDPEAPEEEKKAEDKKAGKSLVVKELRINKVMVTAEIPPELGAKETYSLTLDPIHMTDVGKDIKMDTAQLIAKILTSIANEITKQGTGILPKDILAPLDEVLGEKEKQLIEKGLGDAIQGLFKKNEDE